ncbi:SIR2-domain-containing protein [Morchella conica CCBAS932]|uniref:SIR2-domain-containing protein n=1 Tax=Morchella conica CCBAS932 TaxID=1392247 RepID=A0A3N4KZU3_9PEZI|nr:SIR2-domain-containing protein [Morchella conica CCBAS932]
MATTNSTRTHQQRSARKPTREPVVEIPDSDEEECSDGEAAEEESSRGASTTALVGGNAGHQQQQLAGSEDEQEEEQEQEQEEEDDDDEGDMWENESLLRDVVGDGSSPVIFEPHEDAFSAQDAKELRQLLRQVGEQKFLELTVMSKSGGITAKKLITAFGIRPPEFLEGSPDHVYYRFLQIGIARELVRRTKLPQYNSPQDVKKLLLESKNIIVLTGAGISTSLGIPDFRSKETGLYSRLASLGLSDPQEVFDLAVFNDDPTIFYSVAKDILPTTEKFSPTHAFIELLQRKNKLLTQYTQNIDNLETLAGIHPSKLIQCHGSFATASCIKCRTRVPGTTIFPDLRAGKVARCEACLLANKTATAGRKRKRGRSGDTWKKKRYSEDSSAEEEEFEFREAGVMKPDITFFGEMLPDTFYKRLMEQDREKCDLLICIGTSLKVAPVSEIIGLLPEHVPQIYISKTPVTHVEFDVDFLGSCDDVVVELCRLVGWELKHEMIPEDLKVDMVLEEGYPSRYICTRKEEREQQQEQVQEEELDEVS